MKKKLLGILLLSICIFTHGKTVLADTLPKEYEHDGYTYSIEGFALRVYDFELDKEEETSINTVTITKDSMFKYVSDRYSDEIVLTLEDLTYNPTYHEEVINDLNVTMIDLGVNITEEKLRSLLQDKFSSINEDKNYYVELVVKYKFKSMPDKYTTIKSLDFYKAVLLFSNIEDLNDLENINEYYYHDVRAITNSFTLNEENVQRISNFIIRSNELEYTKDITEEDAISLFSLTVLSDEEEEDQKTIIFTNVNSTKKIADGITKFLEENESGDDTDVPDNPETGTEIKVPDTAMNHSMIPMMIGILISMIGLGVIAYTIRKKSMN